MTQPEVGRPTRQRLAPLWRLLSCIRFDEVCVLQGAPVIGACFAIINFHAATLLTIAALIAGNLLLVAHVFVLNDWAGAQTDLHDPTRAKQTYLAKGENAERMKFLAWALLILALLVFATIGRASFAIAALIAMLSAIYSLPGLQGKGVPLLNSLLHVLGGTLHFLLGYVALSPISSRSVAIGCYFGLVFAAGHLIHETRDHNADQRNCIRTNAVAFGKRASFLVGTLLFSVAYITLTVMAWRGLVPFILSLAVALYVIHLCAAWRALRDGLTYTSVRRLQSTYRNIHVLIGIVMLFTVPPW